MSTYGSDKARARARVIGPITALAAAFAGTPPKGNAGDAMPPTFALAAAMRSDVRRRGGPRCGPAPIMFGTSPDTTAAGASNGRQIARVGMDALFGKHTFSCSSVGRPAGIIGGASMSRDAFTRLLMSPCPRPKPSRSNACSQRFP